MTIIEVSLVDPYGREIGWAHVDFPSTLGCNSDLMQKMGNYVLNRGTRYFTFHRITGPLMCSFKEREFICV